MFENSDDRRIENGNDRRIENSDHRPTPVGGHLVVRDVRGDPSLSPVEYRCVECGLVFDPDERDQFESVPCAVTSQKNVDGSDRSAPTEVVAVGP